MASMDQQINVCQLISLMESTKCLSQTEVVVSVMGCLSGSPSVCFDWCPTEQHFYVKKGLSCDQFLNQTLLHNYLNYYCNFGTAFRVMFDFCYNEVKNEDEVICYTFNAFRSSLRYLLIDCIKHFNTITDYLINNNNEDRKISLLGLKYWLNSDSNHNLLLRIEILWQIFERIREIAFLQNNNYSLSFTILSAIYERIDFQKSDIRNIIFKLLIDCLKPTLDYFDHILTDGEIRDFHQEFVFIESDIELLSNNFWSECLKVRCDTSEMPQFLSKHLTIILIAAKSRIMSQRVIVKTDNKTNENLDLFNKFFNIVNELFHKSDYDINKMSSNETNDQLVEPIVEMNSNDTIVPQSLSIDPMERTEYDSDLNFFDVYSLYTNKYFYNFNIGFELIENNDFIDYELPQKCFKPIELILNEALTLTFGKICADISSQLINQLINEYKRYFNNFCDFYLLRSSVMIPSYCMDLFQTINAMNSSKSLFDSLCHLENDNTFDTLTDIKPFISYNEYLTDPIQLFKNIHLIYKSIDWPFDSMFDHQVIELMDKVFQLLLKVKYSKWVLDQLMFTPEFKLYQIKNRLQYIMRFKLQNSVNKLYNYLMNRIDGYINETIDSFESLTNFEELLEIHNKFLIHLKQTIFYKQKTLRNIINKLIELCLQLEKIWKSETNVNDGSIIKSIDLDIDRCNHLLECFYDVLNNN